MLSVSKEATHQVANNTMIKLTEELVTGNITDLKDNKGMLNFRDEWLAVELEIQARRLNKPKGHIVPISTKAASGSESRGSTDDDCQNDEDIDDAGEYEMGEEEDWSDAEG
ncbi:hypothetical protein N9L19_01480 [bacterium]|nr:hypothetical protein [bacterium]